MNEKERQPSPSTEAEDPPPRRPAQGPTAMGPRPWTLGGGGQSRSSTRWASVGCAAVVVALLVLLVVGVGLTKRTAWIAFARGRQRLVEVAGREHPTERLRTRRNLELFAARLRASRDPYPILGEFLARERSAFADGRLDADELADLNRFLAGGSPAGTGAPP